jgi:ectoine hydroxylase-related dioxygenase (phytanoyl-CoA dioxygenase family)
MSSAATELAATGFTTIPDIYTPEEVAQILDHMGHADKTKDTFRKSAELFAIRQFLKEIPGTVPLIFNESLQNLIRELFGPDYFVVKSIYFDKPGSSNWYVSYHQDLTISVDRRTDIPGFGPWTVKQNLYAVQPPLACLQHIYTLRIHLDDTDEHNGALKIIAGSHHKGIYRPETIDWQTEQELSCPVPQGGVMIMRPLLLHSSGRTTNERKRRVIHIELAAADLPAPLQWAERLDVLSC